MKQLPQSTIRYFKIEMRCHRWQIVTRQPKYYIKPQNSHNGDGTKCVEINIFWNPECELKLLDLCHLFRIKLDFFNRQPDALQLLVFTLHFKAVILILNNVYATGIKRKKRFSTRFPLRAFRLQRKYHKFFLVKETEKVCFIRQRKCLSLIDLKANNVKIVRSKNNICQPWL